MDIVIREEQPADRPAVYAVEAAAFARPDEANLVKRLWQADVPLISLVAEAAGQVVGHALFTPVTVVGEHGRLPAVGLGPIAITPAYQRQGIGGQLIRAGLAASRAAGYAVAFVLGHPAYYPRFGFEVSRPYGLTCAYDVPDNAFMVMALQPGALAGIQGVVHYRPEFDGV